MARDVVSPLRVCVFATLAIVGTVLFTVFALSWPVEVRSVLDICSTATSALTGFFPTSLGFSSDSPLARPWTTQLHNVVNYVHTISTLSCSVYPSFILDSISALRSFVFVPVHDCVLGIGNGCGSDQYYQTLTVFVSRLGALLGDLLYFFGITVLKSILLYRFHFFFAFVSQTIIYSSYVCLCVVLRIRSLVERMSPQPLPPHLLAQANAPLLVINSVSRWRKLVRGKFNAMLLAAARLFYIIGLIWTFPCFRSGGIPSTMCLLCRADINTDLYQKFGTYNWLALFVSHLLRWFIDPLIWLITNYAGVYVIHCVLFVYSVTDAFYVHQTLHCHIRSCVFYWRLARQMKAHMSESVPIVEDNAAIQELVCGCGGYSTGGDCYIDDDYYASDNYYAGGNYYAGDDYPDDEYDADDEYCAEPVYTAAAVDLLYDGDVEDHSKDEVLSDTSDMAEDDELNLAAEDDPDSTNPLVHSANEDGVEEDIAGVLIDAPEVQDPVAANFSLEEDSPGDCPSQSTIRQGTVRPGAQTTIWRDGGRSTSPPERRQHRSQPRSARAPEPEPEADTEPLLPSSRNANHYSPRFPPGHLLNSAFLERYELTSEELGVDATGFRLKARRYDSDRWISVKFLLESSIPPSGRMNHPEHGNIPIEVAMSLHPGKVLVGVLHRPFTDDLYYYLPQEIGSNLSEYILTTQYQQRRIELTRYVFAHLVEAVHHLHSQGVVHGNICPESIVVTESAEVKLSGLATAQYPPAGAFQRNAWSEYSGSFAYAPPEVVSRGFGRYSPAAADIWSLGVTLGVLLLGYSPFDSEQAIVDCRTQTRSQEDIQLLHDSGVLDLMFRCLVNDSTKRATTEELRNHPWLKPTDTAAIERTLTHAGRVEATPFSPSFLSVSHQSTPLPSSCFDNAPFITASQAMAVSARQFCSHFPEGHALDKTFLRTYQPGTTLGAGGFGFVIKALHRARRQEAAVKFVRKDRVFMWADDAEHGQLPLEIKIMKLAIHENVARCLDVFQDETYVYIGIELHGSWWTSAAAGSGNSLTHYMYREGRFSETKAKYVFGQIVEAVHYLDSIGISHGDIKPLNALIDTELKVKLIDYGNAKLDDPTTARSLYPTDEYCGTVVYMAPEIFTRSSIQYAPADVWSLGVLLFELFMHDYPFPDKDHIVKAEIEFCGQNALSRYYSLSEDVRSLISTVCFVPQPEDRGTIQDVRAHPWLQGWQTLGLMMDVLKAGKG